MPKNLFNLSERIFDLFPISVFTYGRLKPKMGTENELTCTDRRPRCPLPDNAILKVVQILPYSPNRFVGKVRPWWSVQHSHTCTTSLQQTVRLIEPKTSEINLSKRFIPPSCLSIWFNFESDERKVLQIKGENKGDKGKWEKPVVVIEMQVFGN